MADTLQYRYIYNNVEKFYTDEIKQLLDITIVNEDKEIGGANVSEEYGTYGIYYIDNDNHRACTYIGHTGTWLNYQDILYDSVDKLYRLYMSFRNKELTKLIDRLE